MLLTLDHFSHSLTNLKVLCGRLCWGFRAKGLLWKYIGSIIGLIEGHTGSLDKAYILGLIKGILGVQTIVHLITRGACSKR